MNKKIKNNYVIVVGSGPSLKKYWNKIEKFIKENNVVIFGCNYITDFLIPDYHFWGSAKRWEKYSKFIDTNKSLVIVSEHFKKNKIHGDLLKKWGKKYITFKNIERRWKLGSEDIHSKLYKRCCIRYKNGKMYGCVRDIATWAIFYAYIKGALKISVVGNDGYTLYKKNDLKNDKESQHCYGKGFTDGFTYQYCRKKDWDKYRTLKLLHQYGKKKYGFGFDIITPTIYRDFYNSSVLKIKEDNSWQEWKEPTKEEYKKMYIKYTKNRKIKDPKY